VTEEEKRQDEEASEETRLNILYAFTVTTSDGREAIASFEQPDGSMLPMASFSEEKVEEFKPIAQAIADALERPVNLIKFEKRTEVEKITPKKVVQLH